MTRDATVAHTADANLGRIFAEPAAYADPVAWHATAARLRREQPISKVVLPDYPEFWAITKHADVMEIERNAEIFTNEPSPALTTRKEMERNAAQSASMKSLVQMDGDEHKAHRNLVSDWFKPGNVKRMSDRVDELAVQYVDKMAALGGECDFATDIAMHYPLQVILSILGLPEDDYDKMLKLTQELFGAEDPDIGRAGEDHSVLEVMLDFVAYFTQLANDRRSHPTGDLASVIANAELGGAPLPDMDVFGFYLIIATAGHDTTSNSIAGGLLALLEHRDQLELLQEKPELIDAAADELIRYVSPVKHFIRTCRAPFTLRDTTFQPGDLTLLSYASANRDDEVFEDPFHFDITRANASSHLAFGFGRHFCLGAHLARMEIRAIFRALLGRLESVELTTEPTFVQSRLVSGPKTLPIRYQFR
jgi:cytochrome P450